MSYLDVLFIDFWLWNNGNSADRGSVACLCYCSVKVYSTSYISLGVGI